MVLNLKILISLTCHSKTDRHGNTLINIDTTLPFKMFLDILSLKTVFFKFSPTLSRDDLIKCVLHRTKRFSNYDKRQ